MPIDAPRATRTTSTPLEAAVVVAICFGLSIYASLQAMLGGFQEVGSFSDRNMIWLIGTELVLATLALVYLDRRGFAVATLLPRPSVRGGLVGIGLFLLAWAVGWLVVTPFEMGRAEEPIDKMMAEATLTLPVIVLAALVNGLFEEMFLLGFLARALRGFGLAVALGVPTLVRLSYHLYQGPLGALWVVAVGLVFTVYYARSVQLWPPVFAHMLWDIVPFLLRDN